MKLTEPVGFTLPKKPRVREKEAPPDARKVSVLPIRAGKDERLHGATLRCLIVLCSYCNRAGLTWVSQKKLAEDLKVSRQAITKQMALLRSYGYVEIARKGFKGERSNTLRVIFDDSVTMDDAIALTSSIEDTRPPIIKYEQEKQMEEVDRKGQQRIAQIIKDAIKPVKPRKEFTMPKDGQTITTKRIKADIEKAKQRRSKDSHTQPPEVANESNQQVANKPVDNSLHRQPLEVARVATSEGSAEHSLNTIKKYLKEDCIKSLISSGLSEEQIELNLDVLLEAYRMEGLTPNPDRLAAEILQLSRVG